MNLFNSLCPPRNARRVLRIIGWNLLFIVAGLLLIGIAGEAYFRLIGRFGDVITDLGTDLAYWRFEPGVGLLRPPHAEMTLSNGVEHWTVQRANSLGFLDREPIDPRRAAESCHITIIGDSFVEGREVPLSDKLQVRLEELAAREAPHLNVTTSAFGIQATGQVNQLPFYDRYARRMSPSMVVLVFVENDLRDNGSATYALRPDYVPKRLPYGQAALDEDGNIRWLPPAVDFSDAVFTDAHESRNSWHNRAIYRAADASYFIRWLGSKTKLTDVNDAVYRWFQPSEDSVRRYREWMNLVGKAPTTEENVNYMEAWGFTEFGLDQFKRRADSDGFDLMVLAIHQPYVGGEGHPVFERLSATAESLDIPVVSQRDYIIRRGGRVEDADWETDDHWTPAGHQWAAQAIWEHIEEEWHGQCPKVEPRKDVAVDWIPTDVPTREGQSDNSVLVFQKPFGLHHRFHTPDGRAWVQHYPTFDLKGYRLVYVSVTHHSPAVRSDWHVHLYDDGLTYVKEPCTGADVENRFFLHVFPADESDLPRASQSRGFKNLDFYFEFRGVEFDGICMVSIDLPEYEIARISTGQYVTGSGSEDGLAWGARHSFALPEIVDAVNEIRRSEREPEIRSSFDVYIDGGRLLYVKESCSADHSDLPFFLHVFPADVKDISDGRDESGFENLGFELMRKGGMQGGECFAAVDLPEYDIASIRTGQIADGTETWNAYHNFELPEILDAVKELRQSEREPDIRSNFDVFIYNHQLIYAKLPCDANDRDTPFFLHVFPADEADLPAGREDSGFDNLDFKLIDRGGVHDGDCFAAVDLPDYDIANIRTGQWIRGESSVWEASIEFAE